LLGAIAAVVLLSIAGCGGPTLQPWHTEELEAEFTVDKADEVRSFADYQRLEDELFNQLEKQVYAEMPIGPEHALERYSAGSAADPQHREPNWNRSFELSTEAPAGAVLLLHGMSDSPYTFRALAETLNARGYHVLGLRMPGHGTAPSGLASVSWRDMAAAVAIGMRHLTTQMGDKPIHIVGNHRRHCQTGGHLMDIPGQIYGLVDPHRVGIRHITGRMTDEDLRALLGQTCSGRVLAHVRP